MNFATISPMGFGAPTLHKPANKSTARLYHAPSLFAVKSTFAHKYFRTKWKPGTVRSALNGRKYKHFPPVAVFTLILCKLPSLPSIPWFYFPAGCPLLPDMAPGGQHRRGKCASAFAVPPHPETGHLCCQRGVGGGTLREQTHCTSSSCSSICSSSATWLLLSSHSLKTHPRSPRCGSLLIHWTKQLDNNCSRHVNSFLYQS